MNWPNRNVDLETFNSLDDKTRDLVTRLLDEPTDRDFEELQRHPNSKMLATWLLELPAYEKSYEEVE